MIPAGSSADDLLLIALQMVLMNNITPESIRREKWTPALNVP